MTSLYEDRGAEEATIVARNFLYDMAHSVGKADAKAFHARMELTDPIERLSAGPIHFAFAGWAFVRILPESNPTPDEDCLCSSEGDNCATVANQSQLDTDEDGIGDACDN